MGLLLNDNVTKWLLLIIMCTIFSLQFYGRVKSPSATELSKFCNCFGLIKQLLYTRGSLLSFILLKGVSNQIRGPKRIIEVILYAGDLTVYEPNRSEEQQALLRLHAAATDWD